MMFEKRPASAGVLQIGTPSNAFFGEVLNRPGGFAWWYADLATADGDGLVLIWSLGLPFLQGARSALPRERPVLCVAVYRNDLPTFYSLQRYPSGAGSLDRDGSGHIGHSRFAVERGGDSCHVHAELDVSVIGTAERLIGNVTWSGPHAASREYAGDPVHLWSPLSAHAIARANLRWGDEALELSGTGYVDSNFSAVPLHRQGMKGWRWGRVSFARETFVYYRVDEEEGSCVHLLHQRDDGPLEPIEGDVRFRDATLGRFFVPFSRTIEITVADRRLVLNLGKPVDDGPFYQRFVVHAFNAKGERGTGVSEVLLPPRVDRPWQRPFVDMRVHHVAQKNSMWLPLFSGPNDGRAWRLLDSWRRGAGHAA